MEITVASVLADVGTVFTKATEMVGDVAETVASNPILLLPVLIGLAGVGISFFNQLRN